MFSKWRKLAKHLEQHGRRAPATVVEIARHGSEVRSEGIGISHLMPGSGGDSLLPRNSGGYMVRKAKLAVRPANEPEFEVERKIRFGDWGRYVPKAGEEIEVVYDPNDHEKLLVAPPTAEEEQARTMTALSKADIGFTVGGGGAKGSGEPVSDEQMAQHRQSMDQAQQMLDQAQQFMSGGVPGQSQAEKKDEKRPEDE
jgi:hypothetical protein